MSKRANSRRLMAFIQECGGLVSAAQKLAVQPFTLRKLLRRQPISTQSKQRIEAVLGDVGAAASSTSARSFSPQAQSEQRVTGFENQAPVGSLSHTGLTAYIDEYGILTAARTLMVRPSTLEKVISGQNLSLPTRKKLDRILGSHRTAKAPKSDFNNLSSKLRSMIKNSVSVIELSERFNLRPSTIQKIIDGTPVSPGVHDKISFAMEHELNNPTDARLPMVERLQEIHSLYKDLGTLAAGG
jgi:hypothetical protein